jgi:SAM-dependent methyltransferase
MLDRRSLFLRLRDARRLAYRGAAIIDTPANWLNHKRPWPPIHLRREVGPLRVFESSTAQLAKTLEYEAGLTAGGNLLDVGCGVGALPLALDLYGNYKGHYIGTDVDRRMILWCQKHLANDRMRFEHVNYWSGSYNPNGKRFFPFPVEDHWADAIVMKSVFTHMLPDDVAWYLKETARTLRPDGTAILTAVLYDEATPEVAARFPYTDEAGLYRWERRESPESSIALSRAWMDQQMAEAGLNYEYRAGVRQGPMFVRRAANGLGLVATAK